MNARILYAEDDETLAFLTKDNLALHGYDVVHCADGHACAEAFAAGGFDLCILDIMMPKKDGFELAANIRSADAEVPIIFLSAKTLKEDRIKGLKLGADDYLVKPFSIEELLLKIEIFLKRSQKKMPETAFYRIGSFSFDARNYTLARGGQTTTLTQREAELLEFFLNNRNKVLKREEILKAIWGDDDYFMGRSLDVFISRLRKILAVENSIVIENLHGIGFRFSDKKG
jgi:DNA-binding response OmpR family regulator